MQGLPRVAVRILLRRMPTLWQIPWDHYSLAWHLVQARIHHLDDQKCHLRSFFLYKFVKTLLCNRSLPGIDHKILI